MTDPLSYLFGLEQFGIKFGLESMRAIVDRLGHPEHTFQTVHIAGTNGKGSVTAMVDAGLRAAGHHSARYTSPHLVDLTERFVIDGRPVATSDLVAAVEEVRAAVEGLLRDGVLDAQPTFFEVTTGVALELFRRARVEIATLEVGLGGRLDATNVVAPVVTAITSIALDHEKYLGSTLADIAREKAGIIKPGVPVVVGDVDHEALGAIEAVAHERGAPVIRAWEGVEVVRPETVRLTAAKATAVRRSFSEGGSFMRRRKPDITYDTYDVRTPARYYGEMAFGLQGSHQVANAIVAVRMLELLDGIGITVPPPAVASALAQPSWPGRLDLRTLPDGREVLLDAAHNPAGAAALASYLNEHAMGGLPLVFAVMRDKDIAGMLAALLPSVGRLVLTRASSRRSADPQVLAERARQVAPAMQLAIAGSPAEALDIAWASSPRIIVAGSIFLLGDVLKEIGG